MFKKLKGETKKAWRKGQSAIEYLMTYGWALVVIVITIAALVFLVNPQQLMAAGCTGFSQLPIKTQNLSSTAIGGIYTIIFTNMTGMNLTNATIVLSGDIVDTNSMGTITANQAKTHMALLDVNNDPLRGKASKAAYSIDLNLTYTDAHGFPRSVSATCKGAAP